VCQQKLVFCDDVSDAVIIVNDVTEVVIIRRGLRQEVVYQD